MTWSGEVAGSRLTVQDLVGRLTNITDRVSSIYRHKGIKLKGRVLRRF